MYKAGTRANAKMTEYSTMAEKNFTRFLNKDRETTIQEQKDYIKEKWYLNCDTNDDASYTGNARFGSAAYDVQKKQLQSLSLDFDDDDSFLDD